MSSSTLDEILNRIHALQLELEDEIDRLLSEKRQQFRYRLDQGKVRFEQGIQSLQRHHKVSLWTFLRKARIGHVLTSPIIYSAIIPFVLLDVIVSFYQYVCFPIYGIPKVKRSKYIILDRQHLAYLNVIEKFNCIYCGYGNGLIEYVREVTARTEKYWCPIKHATHSPDPHRLSREFADYGDAEVYKKRLAELRSEIANLRQDEAAPKD